MKFNLDSFHMLGVINMTPDSFSESNESKTPQAVLDKIMSFKNHEQLILDIGFESTAPMNKAISTDDEIHRFKSFLQNIELLKINQFEIISFDTYKIESFDFFYTQMKKIYPHLKFIFNDVSGVFDREIQDYILSHADVYYVYCATRIKSRYEVHAHMKDVSTSPDIVLEVADQFLNVHTWFVTHDIEERLILDPAFGFSKTFEDNWKLIKNFKSLISKLNNKSIFNKLVIGLSKKSFLQKVLVNSVDSSLLKEETEFIHFNLILDFLRLAPLSRFLFRIHDPNLVVKAVVYSDFKSSK